MTLSKSLIPHALIYAFYFSTIGIMVTFFPTYLKGVGLQLEQIGFILAIPPMMVIVGPITWGYLADRIQSPNLILRTCLLFSLCASLLFFFVQTFATISLAMLLYALFKSSIPSLTDAVTLSKIRKSGGDYGRTRVWGSIGFVITAAAMGFIIKERDDFVVISLSVLACLFAAGLASSLLLSSTTEVQKQARFTDVIELLRNPRLKVLLAASAVHWVSLSPFHGFLALRVDDLTLSASTTGTAFAVAGLAEIIMMRYAKRFLGRFTARSLLTLALSLTALRWAVTGWATTPEILISAQVIHAFSFAVFYVSSIDVLTKEVPETLRATGQGLFFAIAFGVGGGGGTLLAGWAYATYGGAVTFYLAALVSVVSVGIVRRL